MDPKQTYIKGIDRDTGREVEFPISDAEVDDVIMAGEGVSQEVARQMLDGGPTRGEQR